VMTMNWNSTDKIAPSLVLCASSLLDLWRILSHDA
jgi:hypothetical protein